jgi:hypothetical protein
MKHVRIIGLLVLLILSVVGYAQTTGFIKNVNGTWTLPMMPDFNATLSVEYKSVSESAVNNITFTRNADGTWTMKGTMPDCDIELVVEYEDLVDYGLSVYSTAVTSENRDDILGNGVFSYDPESKTLTVHDSYLSPRYGTILKNDSVDGLVVNVPGDVSLSALNGMLSSKDMTIQGPGKLSVTTVTTITDMMQGSVLTIRNITIDAASDKWGIAGEGTERLIVENAAIHSKAPNGAVCDFGGGITLRGCKIEVPAGGYVKDDDIVDADGKLAAEVIITKTVLRGDVNLDGQVGIGDIVAITNIMAGIETDPGMVSRADVNGDTQVGIGDIVAITNIMAVMEAQ